MAAQVDWVDTGAEALKWLDAKPFDLIVLDYRLPDTDGIELMKAFRGRGLETPVIFVTTADSVQLAVEAMKLGAEDFVQKQEGYLAVLPLLVREALERQQLRHEKTHLEAELRQAERLASLGILAAGLAHNINNRLTSLKTFFDLLPQRYDDPYFRNEFLKTCQMDLEKIALLVHELTRYAFTEGAASVLQPITELIMRAIGHLDDEIQRKQIRVRTEFAEVPRIPLDPEGVKQLFINLLKNAIQASPVGKAHNSTSGLSTRAPAFPPRCANESSIRSSRPKTTVWGLDSICATRSPASTAAASTPGTRPAGARNSQSTSRPCLKTTVRSGPKTSRAETAAARARLEAMLAAG